MLTRNQKYAAQAFEQVTRVQSQSQLSEIDRRKYGAMAHRLPVLIRSAGLAQALHFVHSRQDSAGPHKLLAHMAEVVDEPDVAALLARSRTGELADYMRLTRDLLAALAWYKRFAQSVLGVQAGDEPQGENT